MDPLLAIGQILVSIALIVAILLQARGVGLSGTFGGDSAVYRSRRGVERRLWQFTIVLLVLFIVFSLAAFILAPPSPPDPAPRRPTAVRALARSSMTRTDSFVVGTLVVLLALIAGLVSAPSLLPATATVATPQPTPGPVVARPYREGVLGRPVSVSPLTARPRQTATSSRSSSPASSATARTGRSCRTWPSTGRSTRPARCGPSSCATTPTGMTASRSPPTTSRTRSASSRTRRTPGLRRDRGTR